MKKQIRQKTIIAIVVLIIGGAIVGMGVKFIAYEKAQNKNINSLRMQLALLSERVNNNEIDNVFAEKVSSARFDYLALGNSITIHPTCDYWFGEWGMAASTEGNDYFHKIISALQNEGKDINAFAYNYSIWEINSHDRSETYSLIDGYLFQGVDLVTIQLGENVNDISSFETDFVELVNFVKESCPDAKIVVIDDFWDESKSEIKRRVSDITGVCFVDLSDIRGKREYQLGTGAIIYSNDGEYYANKHLGVAKHPNDAGMDVIAERVLEKIEE